MIRGFEVPKSIFEGLVKHLVELEKQKDELLEDFFPIPSKERDELEKLIDLYIKQVELLIQEARKSETAGSSLPFVTVGSEVELQDLSTLEVHRFRLVTPFSSDTEGDDVSCISPVGKALLLKRVGDEVTVHAPAGVFRYKIVSIKWHGDEDR
ncbi:MAG: GreA/GreB family elongation factor [Thermicanus sp.]|nr:GreA/GreB family elongation factor [Thermicanus sp.]